MMTIQANPSPTICNWPPLFIKPQAVPVFDIWKWPLLWTVQAYCWLTAPCQPGLLASLGFCRGECEEETCLKCSHPSSPYRSYVALSEFSQALWGQCNLVKSKAYKKGKEKDVREESISYRAGKRRQRILLCCFCHSSLGTTMKFHVIQHILGISKNSRIPLCMGRKNPKCQLLGPLI